METEEGLMQRIEELETAQDSFKKMQSDLLDGPIWDKTALVITTALQPFFYYLFGYLFTGDTEKDKEIFPDNTPNHSDTAKQSG